jgi:hypothetical protein
MKASIRKMSQPFVILLLAGFLAGCSSSGGKQGNDTEIMKAEKPIVDNAMVLETLELYQAKRYESLQEAMAAGIENVHKLVLYGRALGTLSPDIGNLTYLQTFDVARNNLKELPDELSRLHYLQGFYANINYLVEFPNQLLLLPLLKSIDLSDNQIASIPPEIIRMDQLTRLSMDRNLLTEIPVQLYELPNLSVLELSGNGLSKIPEGISNLKNLKKLDLSKNQLSAVPRDMATMSGHLVDLYLQGNRLPQEEIDWLNRALPNTTIRF